MAKAEMAGQVFGQTTELDKKLESSVFTYGGEDLNKEVQSMSEDDVQATERVLTRYYGHLKERFQQDPESLSASEIVAGELAQKVGAGQELAPKEQAKLYTILGELSGRVDDTTDPLAKELKLSFIDTDGNLNNEKQKAYVADIANVRREVFFNLTGFEPTLPEYNQKRVRGEMVDQAAARSLIKPVRKVWEHARIIWGDENGELTKEAYAKQVAENREAIFSGRAGEFKPEQKEAQIRVTVAEAVRLEVLDELTRNFPKTPDRDIIEAQLRSGNAHTYESLGRYLEKIDQSKWGSLKMKYELAKPEEKVEALRAEAFFAEDLDRMARQALERKVPESAVDIQQRVATLEVALKQEKDPNKQERLRKQIAAARYTREQLLLGGKAEQLLKADHKDVDSIAAEVPADLKPDLEDYLARQFKIPLNKSGSRPGKGGAPAVPIATAADYSARRSAINTRLAQRNQKQTSFTVAQLIIEFVRSQM